MRIAHAKTSVVQGPHFNTPAIAIHLSEGNKAPEKIQLFRTGTYHHDDYGILEITPQVLAEMIANFRNDVRGIKLALDFSHKSGEGAAGWLLDVFLTEDQEEMWARVNWTPKGKASVEDKEFLYISPDFGFASQDAETLEWFGPTLNGAGLTNRPFIKRMAPIIQLSEKTTEDIDMTLVEAQKQIEKLEAKNKTLSEQLADANEKVKQFDDAGMSLEDAMAKIKELQDQLASQGAQLADFKKKTADATVQAAEAKKTSEFNLLLSEGKVCEAQRQAFLEGKTAELLRLSEPVNLKKTGTGELPPVKVEAGNPVEAGKEVDKLAKVKLSDIVNKGKSYGDCVRMVLAENRDLAKAYQSL